MHRSLGSQLQCCARARSAVRAPCVTLLRLLSGCLRREQCKVVRQSRGMLVQLAPCIHCDVPELNERLFFRPRGATVPRGAASPDNRRFPRRHLAQQVTNQFSVRAVRLIAVLLSGACVYNFALVSFARIINGLVQQSVTSERPHHRVCPFAACGNPCSESAARQIWRTGQLDQVVYSSCWSCWAGCRCSGRLQLRCCAGACCRTPPPGAAFALGQAPTAALRSNLSVSERLEAPPDQRTWQRDIGTGGAQAAPPERRHSSRRCRRSSAVRGLSRRWSATM